MMDFLKIVQQNWAIIMAVGGAVWTYFWLTLDTKYARKTDVADLRRAIGDNEKSLSEVKGELRHLPTSKDVAELRLLITEMKGKTDTLNVSISGLNHQVKLLIEKEVNKE
jgi:Mu-like phage gp25